MRMNLRNKGGSHPIIVGLPCGLRRNPFSDMDPEKTTKYIRYELGTPVTMVTASILSHVSCIRKFIRRE